MFPAVLCVVAGVSSRCRSWAAVSRVAPPGRSWAVLCVVAVVMVATVLCVGVSIPVLCIGCRVVLTVALCVVATALSACRCRRFKSMSQLGSGEEGGAAWSQLGSAVCGSCSDATVLVAWLRGSYSAVCLSLQALQVDVAAGQRRGGWRRLVAAGGGQQPAAPAVPRRRVRRHPDVRPDRARRRAAAGRRDARTPRGVRGALQGAQRGEGQGAGCEGGHSRTGRRYASLSGRAESMP